NLSSISATTRGKSPLKDGGVAISILAQNPCPKNSVKNYMSDKIAGRGGRFTLSVVSSRPVVCTNYPLHAYRVTDDRYQEKEWLRQLIHIECNYKCVAPDHFTHPLRIDC